MAYKGKDKVDGNFAYADGDNWKIVFYTNGEQPKILGTVNMTSDFDTKEAKTDLLPRDWTALEKQLYKLKESSLKELQDATSFKVVENTHFELIPFIQKGQANVYVISVSDKPGIVVFGNDFVLSYDESLQILKKQALHKMMSSVAYKVGASKNEEGNSHVIVSDKNEMPTSTDIVVLLMNEEATKWTNHAFISENFIYFWNYLTKEMISIPKGDPRKGK